MRRVFVPVMLACAFALISSANASAGLFSCFGKKSCDACCDVEPACGCEIAAPACGCEAPACGCEAPACDSGCLGHKKGLLSRLFAKHHGCDACAPACGCEVAEPACGCEIAAPACGCEAPACDSGCCGIKKPGLFSKLFSHKKANCCEAPAPACGCEPSCGF